MRYRTRKRYKKKRTWGGKRLGGFYGSGIPERDVKSFTVLIDDEKEIDIRRTGESGEWVEYGPYGEKKYMSYLKPSEILSWLRQDFPGSSIKVIAVNDEYLDW
jgi:hypothetical protein